MFAPYRKKPVVIMAERYHFYPGVVENLRSHGCTVESAADWCETFAILIPTLEGKMRCEQGAWIIQGVNGEFYPRQDEIFRKTYEHESGGEI